MAVGECLVLLQDGGALKRVDLVLTGSIGIDVLGDVIFPEVVDGIQFVVIFHVELLTNFGLLECVSLITIAIVGDDGFDLLSSKGVELA